MEVFELHRDTNAIGYQWTVNPRVWRKNLIFFKIVSENCMKMKEIRPTGGTTHPWPANGYIVAILLISVSVSVNTSLRLQNVIS